MTLERVLTGDRTTGKLHLGHYAGSLKTRVELQNRYDMFLLLADVQALTTHFDQPQHLKENVFQVALDYLSAGIDPNKATIIIQSAIPEIAELTIYFSMFVTVNALRHNPTIKAEAKERGYNQMYYGFLGYPVSQAADITFCKASIIPVGDDQVPHIEQTRKIVRRFNELYKPILVEPTALVGARIVGLDGHSKMSKSLGNGINLDSTAQEVVDKLRKAVTDPARIHKNDPGHPDICPIYAYHKAFREQNADEIYENCTQGTIGCASCKSKIADRINELLEPMHERRSIFASQPKLVHDIVQSGTEKARRVAKETLREVREAMSMNYYD